ncbi:MAG: hypothetical protein RL624_463 [Bacteroidota bacterium]|jgi:Protein of unknown function (DUF2452)
MIQQAYNFLAAWQLVPEQCLYEKGTVPTAAIFTILGIEASASFSFKEERTIDQQKEQTAFEISFQDQQVQMPSALQFNYTYTDSNNLPIRVQLDLLPNGNMKRTLQGFDEYERPYCNIEFYHKQLSVLAYATSASSAIVRPTKEGVIKNKALLAMEEQTNMQLEQIRKQIELLAAQAQAIQNRKALSMMIYEAQMSFKPLIGHTYHLYEKEQERFVLSLIGPQEWGSSLPFKHFIASVKLLADHTWVEIK